ncbi:MAG: electron transfer flavoprotein subunit beta/FixA family protein [Spirochaetia bacterium]|nr:electron transfer flavoprotein subunit beta/FixA family protein [Spirochaetia bacterium]
MKIICVVKFVPDVDNFTYDHQRHIIIRENSQMMINPDDACAIGFALNMKKRNPETHIEVVTMAPQTIIPLLEDILRVGVDTATIITDKLYAGSDTWATSHIIARYLNSASFDTILTGSHAIDGDTSHVPSQIASLLGLNQTSFISRIDEESFSTQSAIIEVEEESSITTFEIDQPAILSITREAPYRLPYVRYKNLHLDVKDRLTRITNKELMFSEDEVGLKGSKTKVARTYTKEWQERKKVVVSTDQGGIDTVYEFLKEKKFI